MLNEVWHLVLSTEITPFSRSTDLDWAHLCKFEIMVSSRKRGDRDVIRFSC